MIRFLTSIDIRKKAFWNSVDDKSETAILALVLIAF